MWWIDHIPMPEIWWVQLFPLIVFWVVAYRTRYVNDGEMPVGNFVFLCLAVGVNCFVHAASRFYLSNPYLPVSMQLISAFIPLALVAGTLFQYNLRYDDIRLKDDSRIFLIIAGPICTVAWIVSSLAVLEELIRAL